jgi:hypothetical protein
MGLTPRNDVQEWKELGFQYFDQPNSQVDAIWWDFDPQEPMYKHMHADTEVDLLALVLEETHRRGLEAFWHNRISEVEGNEVNPIKAQHPDWVIKTWWWQGMWNLAVPEVRDFKVELIRQMAERYDFDGYQIDYARHIPVLPIGRQWELRDSVTDLMRRLRETLLEVSAAKNKPILLSAKVPRSLEVCRADGFDVVRWVQDGLVDMLTLGSRSFDVDIEGYREALGPSVKLYPCLDDHHTSDAYQFPPVEVFRGVASSWLRQGADGIETFNWYGGPVPESSVALEAPWGARPGPESQRTAYREIGSVETLNGKSKSFPVERREGYPWSEGASGHNLHAQLPLKLAYDGRPSDVRVYCAEDLKEEPEAKRNVSLRLTIFDSEPGDRLEVKLNGGLLGGGAFDYDWKDPKIFSPMPQQTAGSYGYREVDPEQRLLLVTYDVDPDDVLLGDNTVSISVTQLAPPYSGPGRLVAFIARLRERVVSLQEQVVSRQDRAGRSTEVSEDLTQVITDLAFMSRQLQVEKVELHVIYEDEAI